MPLRVLLYSRVNPADGGGVQAVINRLAHHLDACGHRATKAWGRENTSTRGDLTYPLPLLVWRRGMPAPRSATQVVRALLRLSAGLARLRPEIVNCHFVTAEVLYFLILRPLFRYKVVLSVHGSDVLRPKPWDAPLLPRILGGADAITAVSRRTEARIREIAGIDPARIRLIPNGVDYGFWNAAAASDLSRRAPTVVTVGRLHHVKGQDVLLSAFARVLPQVPSARLVIIGDGGTRAELEELAGSLGVAAAVEFAGRLDADAVRARLRTARVFALPSRSEGLPLALLEAMAAGVPAVATDVGGVPEVMASGSGLIVPPEDPAALADAVSEVLLDSGLAVALSQGGQAAASQFSAAAVDEAYEALLRHLVDGRSA